MLPENIDDLFRGKLDGHETPPGDDLWARLRAQPSTEPAAPPTPEASAERLDQLFRAHLQPHVSPPPRELWERLEDEHLRPRRRRAAAWWPLAIAAALALLIVAGGTGRWPGFPTGNAAPDAVTVRRGPGSPAPGSPAGGAPHAHPGAAADGQPLAPRPAPTTGAVAARTSPRASANEPAAPQQKKSAPGATPVLALASSASKARKLAERQSPRHPLGRSRQPDAAAPSPSLVARSTAPAPTRNTAADEPRLSPVPAPVVAQAPAPVPAPEIVPAGTIITVDVRNGAGPAPRSGSATLAAVVAPEAPAERRGLGGRLLQQAGHLVRGERLSLAEATGLPENVTLRANIAGRSVSKSIQL